MIHLVSDLHLEFQSDGGQSLVSKLPEADTIVVAGDLTTCPKIHGALKMLAKKYQNVVYVPGNHDWYAGGSSRIKQQRALVLDTLPNVHWLDGDTVTIDGQRFVGCTLWFPDTVDARQYQYAIADFSSIVGLNSWIWHAFKSDRNFLDDEIQPDDIVVTHHLPHPKSVAPRFLNSKLNCYFLGNCAGLIDRHQPKVWCHGHTHDACDYMVGKTRVVCNPIGYPRETGADVAKLVAL